MFFFNIEAVLQWLVYVPLCSRSPVRFLLISYLVGQNFIVTSKNLSHFCPKKRDSRQLVFSMTVLLCAEMNHLETVLKVLSELIIDIEIINSVRQELFQDFQPHNFYENANIVVIENILLFYYFFYYYFITGNTVSNVVFIAPPLLTTYHLWKHKLSEFGPIACLLSLSGIILYLNTKYK